MYTDDVSSTTGARQSSVAATGFVPLKFMKEKPIKASLHDDQEQPENILLIHMFKGLGFGV